MPLGHRFLVIDTSRFFEYKMQDQIGLEVSQLARTARLGGGSGVWGAGISDPTSRFWNLDFGVQTEWGALFEKLRSSSSVPNSLTEFGTSIDELGYAVVRSSPNRQAQSQEMVTERHVRARYPKASVERMVLTRKPLAGLRLAKLLVKTDRIEVTLVDDNSSRYEFVSKKLFLASGAFMNGLLAAYIRQIESFDLGNHISLPGPNYDLGRELYLRSSVHYPGARDWMTFSDSSMNIASGLRFVQDSSVHGIDSVLSAKTISSAASIFQRLASTKLQISRNVSSLIMIDSRPEQTLAVRPDFKRIGASGALTVSITTQNRVDVPKVIELANKLSLDVGRMLKVEPDSDLPPGVRISDSAHYYGSTPIGKASASELSTDVNGGLHGFEDKVFVLGSAVMPEGGHAHPTALIYSLSHYISKRILA